MKAYLAVTGTIFALLGALHLWRAVAERDHLTTDPAFFFSVVGIGVVAAGLAVWAIQLLRRP